MLTSIQTVSCITDVETGVQYKQNSKNVYESQNVKTSNIQNRCQLKVDDQQKVEHNNGGMKKMFS